MTTANDLPPLPEPNLVSRMTSLGYYGDDQMREYARTAVAAALSAQQAPAAQPGMALVPRVSLQSWLAAFDEEAAAYYPDAIEHVSRSGDEIRAVLAARPQAQAEPTDDAKDAALQCKEKTNE